MTEFQQFIQRQAREMAHLYCAVCRARPPRFAGGLCAACSDEDLSANDHAKPVPCRGPYAHALTDTPAR